MSAAIFGFLGEFVSAVTFVVHVSTKVLKEQAVRVHPPRLEMGPIKYKENKIRRKFK